MQIITNTSSALHRSVADFFIGLMVADLKAAPAVDPADRAACAERLKSRGYTNALSLIDEARAKAAQP